MNSTCTYCTGHFKLNGVTSCNDHMFWMYLLSFLSKRHNIRGSQTWWASGPRRIPFTAVGGGCSGSKSPDGASSKAAHMFPASQPQTINVYIYTYIYINTQPATIVWPFSSLADQNQVHHWNTQTQACVACLSISWLWTLGQVSSWLPDCGVPPGSWHLESWRFVLTAVASTQTSYSICGLVWLAVCWLTCLPDWAWLP